MGSCYVYSWLTAALSFLNLECVEAQIKGEQWKSEVSYLDSERWRPFDDWKETYEPAKPKKEDSERKKKVKAKAAAKVKETLLAKLQDGVSAKLLMVTLEVASKLLTMVENEASAKNGQHGQVVSSVLNSMNGIILTYRFGKSNKSAKKCAYLRRVASDQLTDTLLEMLQGAEDQTKRVQALQEEISSLLLSKKSEVKTLASDKLDGLIFMADDKLDGVAEKGLAGVEVKLEQVKGTADVALGVAGVSAPSPELLQGVNSESVKTKKDELVEMFGVFLKQMILGEMETLTDMVELEISGIIEKCGEAVANKNEVVSDMKAGAMEGSEEEAIRGDMFSVVEAVYVQVEQTMYTKVGDIVAMLGSLMEQDDEIA